MKQNEGESGCGLCQCKYPGIHLERLRETMEKPVRMAGVPAKIQIRYLLNTNITN